MWKRSEDKIKARLLGLKKINVEGFKFTIKKVNPFIDFPSDKIPQIFTDFISRRPIDTSKQPSPLETAKTYEYIKVILQAGVYFPKLVPSENGDKRGKEGGITVNDLFIDEDIAYKLYLEIMTHSLNKFKGIKGFFLYQKIRLWLSTRWQLDTGKLQ